VTKDDWAKVEEVLSGYRGRVTMKVDGREVTFRWLAVGKNRLAIATFIDGSFEGVWLDPEKAAPEQRYLRPVSKFAWNARSRREMKKLSKRRLNALGYDPDEKWHGFRPFWPNATAIRRHYQKTFESIELIEVVG
jgi:hypothetical protein